MILNIADFLVPSSIFYFVKEVPFLPVLTLLTYWDQYLAIKF